MLTLNIVGDMVVRNSTMQNVAINFKIIAQSL